MLVALLPLVGLLLLGEVALWALGLGDPQERLALMRGFSEDARYLVPDPGCPGGWRTQVHDDPQREVRIGPGGSRLRVLLVGGSNTQGFPAAYLEQRLNELAPDPGFEVVNLGRAGYGSERVRILLGQAMVLEPDIVLIYCGHNEFVEQGFAIELLSAWRRPWLARAAEALARLRTLNVLVSLFEHRPAPEAAVGPRPEERRVRTRDFEKLDYDGTLSFYEVYRDNLQALIRMSREHGAQVLLCTVVGNMLYPPVVPGTPEGLSAAQLARFHDLQRDATALVPARLASGLMPADSGARAIQLIAQDWGEAVPAPELLRRRSLAAPSQPPALRPLLGAFAGGPWWNDPASWTPAVMELLPALAALHRRELQAAERADIERAVALLAEARELCPTDSLLLFQSGLCTYLLGTDDAQACELLRQAARFDRAPTRGNDLSNGIVRELAAAHPEVLLVDAEDIVRQCCPSGLIGYEVVEDNCHLHPALRPRLLDTFIPGLLELGRRCATGSVRSSGH